MASKLWGIFCLCGLFLSTSACNLTIMPPPSAQSNANSVIFTAEQSAEYRREMDTQTEEFWTPTAADVAALETDLIPFLQTAEDRHFRPSPPIWERVPAYKRQYMGLVEEGERVIYANFFCNADAINWQEEWAFVMDGGDCFFNVKYNIETGEFFELIVNGEA
jgi:hypothetical protein